MHYYNKILLLIFNLFFLFIDAQELQNLTYKNISELYEGYPENDSRAMVFVNRYIEKAKKEGDLQKQVRGYEEAIYYTKDVNSKLSYADSAIAVASKTNDSDIISRAFLGKGIIYYYNNRQYKNALDLYLKAYKFSKNSKDDYLKNKILYHLGMLKSYLGSYQEAAAHFRNTAKFFEENMKGNLHPNIKFNIESGYFNSIYRLSTCYKNLHLYKKEDSLINIGLQKLQNINHHLLEYGYFQKGKGVQLLRAGQLDKALKHLELSRDILVNNQDYGSLTNVYFYIGKLYWLKKNRTESLIYLNKVDSMIHRFRFVTPEIRSNYEYLITDAQENGNRKKQLYYMNRLLKADSAINVDFVRLSSKIHKEYDRDRLMKEIKLLENDKYYYIYIILEVIAILFVGFLVLKQPKENKVVLKFSKVLKKLIKPISFSKKEIETDFSGKKITYSSEIIEDIKSKLKKFEEEKQFLTKNLTLPKVAKMFGRTHSQLSFVLNEHLDMSFTTYLKSLRIKYITALLLEENIYLQYKLDILADKCGMTNRQSFSLAFLEINGIRPVDFINRRKEELGKM